jgi:hypothetical protein
MNGSGTRRWQARRPHTSASDLRQIQYCLYHLLDLLFIRSSIANHRLLHLQRRVFKNPDPGSGCSCHSDSPAMRGHYRRFYICIEKQLLNRNGIRLELIYYKAYLPVQL